MELLEKLAYLALYLGATLAIYTGLSACERGMDAIHWPKSTVKSATVNVSFLLLHMAIAPVTYFFADHTQSIYDSIGLPRIATESWHQLPLWVAMIAWAVLHDFYIYWVHRLFHSPLLWPIHSVHHSDPDLNNTTAFRNHFIELWAMAVATVVFASWAGLPPEAIAVATFWITLYDRYIHLRVDWHHGILHYVFVSPRFHQWHHADDPAAYNTNFSNLLSVWDVLFGTYRVPGPCRHRFGVSGMPQNNIPALLLWPFKRWREMYLNRRSVGREPPL